LPSIDRFDRLLWKFRRNHALVLGLRHIVVVHNPPLYLLFGYNCSVSLAPKDCRVSVESFSRLAPVTMVRASLTGSQGKRYNVLRDRVDSWDYSIDQLVLGTMLFTLVAFLAPTVIMYYALFALVSLFVRHNLFNSSGPLTRVDPTLCHSNARVFRAAYCIHESFPPLRFDAASEGSSQTSRWSWVCTHTWFYDFPPGKWARWIHPIKSELKTRTYQSLSPKYSSSIVGICIFS
jgi:hypothetical protein